MSQVIDTKVVEMQFDNSKFEKNIEVSLNSLKNLNKNIDDAGKNRNSLDDLAKAGDRVGVSFDNMNVKSKIGLNMMDLLSGVGTKAFNRISDAVAGFVLNMTNALSGMQAMRDGFAEYELKMGSVQTMLVGAKIIDPKTAKATKDEARRLEIINDELAKLNDYSDKTIYSFKDMTSNIGKFTNNGVELHDAVQAIQGVANVAAAAGANSNEASRAMYNFSQALSSGAVKLIDWKSIENANMATQDFKQQLLDTALALGTVEKSGKEYISTTKDLQGKVSDAFTKTKGFNDSLSHQWMTTDVLTQTLKNYSTDVRDMSDGALREYKNSLLEIGYTTKQVDRIIENSRKAFEAATEVKTFTQMIDTLKESLGSGWAQTFEIVIGDFNEAKQLFTGLNNAIDNLLSPIGKARNAILQMWKDDGGRDALLNTFSNLYHAVLNLFDPLKQLWKAFTPNTKTTGSTLAKISKWIEQLSAKIRTASDFIGRTLAKLLQPLVRFGNYLSKILPKAISKVFGIFSKLANFFKPLVTAIKTFGIAIKDAFSNKVVSKIKAVRDNLSNTFKDLKKRLGESKAVKNLVDAFKSLKTIIEDLFNRVVRRASIYADGFVEYLGKIWKAVKPLISSAVTTVIKKLSDFLLPKLRKGIEFVTDKIRDFGKLLSKINIKDSALYKGLAGLPDTIEAIGNSKGFKTFASTVKGFAQDAVGFLSEKFETLKTIVESFHMPKGLSDMFEQIKKFIGDIFGKESIGEKAEESTKKIDEIANEQSGEKLTAFQKFLEGVSKAFDWLKGAADKAYDAIKTFVDFIKTNTPKAIKDLHDFFAGEDGILTLTDATDAIITVSDALSGLLASFGIKSFGDAADNISGSFDELSNSVVALTKATSNKMKMSALKDFAIAVAILSGALFLLAQVPYKQLAAASAAILILGKALSYFFNTLSTGDMDISKTVGNLSIGALLLSIGGALIGVAVSVGILVLALKEFPKVIEQYNDLGETFKTGMKRVQEVMEEIFSYLDHAAGSKYSFRSAVALLALVKALSKMRKAIEKYASEETGKAMTLGLERIKKVLKILSDFLSDVSLSNFGLNIGIKLDTVGLAAMIWALGDMMGKIAKPISDFAQLKPVEFITGFKALKLIFHEFTGFMVTMALMSRLTGTGLKQWLGIALNIQVLASAIGSIVASVESLATVAKNNPLGMIVALQILGGLFLALGALLVIIGNMKPSKAVVPLFGLSLAIGVLTACVIALVPLAATKPKALLVSVLAVGALMVALGGALLLAGMASGQTSAGDIIKLIAMTVAMVILAQAIRRLARVGDPGSIVAAAAAISIAVFSMVGAIAILNALSFNPLVLAALALLAVIVWGAVAAIHAFNSTASEVPAGAKQVSDGAKEMEDSMSEMSEKAQPLLKDFGSTFAKDLFGEIGPKIGEAIRNFNLGTYLREKFEQLKADAKNWAQDWIDIGTNLMDGIAVALENPANIERVKGCMKAVGTAILDAFLAFFGIASPSTVMITQGGYIIDGLVQGLMTYPSKLAGWVQGIGSFILDGIKGFFKNAVDKGKEFAGNIGTGIQNGKNAVAKKAQSLGKAALDKVGKAKDWAKRAASSAKSFAGKLGEHAGEARSSAGKMVAGALTTLKTVQVSFSKNASTAASSFAAKLRAGATTAKAAGSSLINSAKNAFKNIGSSFRTYGVNAAQGFRNGIASLISSVAAKARAMVKAAKDAAKAEQNSSSPSKDFMEYGGWAAQGYALGMTNRKNTKLVQNSAKKMVGVAKGIASSASFGSSSMYLDSNPAMRSLALALGQISDSLDESMETSPTIRPVIDLSGVNKDARTLAALFDDRQIGARVDARFIQDDFNDTMANRNAVLSASSIDELANRITGMTDAMNSRQVVINATVEGSENPEVFADKLIRRLQLKARAI